MVVQYLIDWDSLYEDWLCSRAEDACNEAIVIDFVSRLTNLRRCIVRNGLLYQDQSGIALRGLRKMLDLVKQDPDEGKPVYAWIRLSDELKQYHSLYSNPEYRIIVPNNDNDYDSILIAANRYLAQSRISRSVYKYPAVIISERSDLCNDNNGFSPCSLDAYYDSHEEAEWNVWANGVSVNPLDMCVANRLFSAMAIAAGSVDGVVRLYDPHWSGKVLVDPPDNAWINSISYMMKFFAGNRYVKRVEIVSSDEIQLNRRFVFTPFVNVLCDICRQRPNQIDVLVGLRENELKQGRKWFHNRYIALGRFLIQIPDGLDIIDCNGSVRNFTIAIHDRKDKRFEEIADENGSNVIYAKHIHRLVGDYCDNLLMPTGAGVAGFRVQHGCVMKITDSHENDF